MLINLVKTVNHWVKSSYTRDWFSPLVSLNGTHKFVHSNSLEVKTDPSFVTTFNSVVHSFHAILSTPVRKRNILEHKHCCHCKMRPFEWFSNTLSSCNISWRKVGLVEDHSGLNGQFLVFETEIKQIYVHDFSNYISDFSISC